MSATIILIMTSSSTRNTEPPGGRVTVMMISLPVSRRVQDLSVEDLSQALRFANNANRCNVNVSEHALVVPSRIVADYRAGLIARCGNAKVRHRFTPGKSWLGKKLPGSRYLNRINRSARGACTGWPRQAALRDRH